MKIVRITKTGLFYKVKFDDDSSYKFHESIIVSYGFIRKGIEVSEECLTLALKDNEYYLALDKAINYLTAIRSKKEVQLYLRKNFDNEIAQKVLLQLEKLKLLNDKEYAIYFVEYFKKKGYGINKIINELKEQEITENDIEEAIIYYGKDEMLNNCEKCLLKYLPSLKKDSKAKIIQKATNYLIGRGFSNDFITIVLENNRETLDNISDEDELLRKNYLKLLKSKNSKIDEKKFRNKVIRSLTNKGFPLYKVLKIMEGETNYD